MNRGKKSLIPVVGGYTIVEVLIFLAVSGMMFFMALTFIGGQQNKAQFVSAVRDFESQLTDIANDVSTGYYVRPVDFTCTTSAITPVPAEQGTNGDCIFLGTVLKFGTDGGNREQFMQFTMAGLRQSGGENVTSVAQANPRPIYGAGLEQAAKTVTLGYGSAVRCIAFNNATSCTPGSNTNAAFGFFTTFGGVSPAGGTGIQTDLLPYSAVTFNENIAATVAKLRTPDIAANALENILICIESGATNQYAFVKIGGNNTGSSVVTTEIRNTGGGSPLCG